MWQLDLDDVDPGFLPGKPTKWAIKGGVFLVRDSELVTLLRFTVSFSCSKLLSSSPMASKIMSLFLSMILLVGLVSSAKFDELFQPYWASDHFTYEGELLHMKLDNYSGIYISHSKRFNL